MKNKKVEKNEAQILKPGIGVDVVFNLDSLRPVIRSSILFECDYKKNELIVAQPSPVINQNSQYDQMHITTLVNDVHAQRIGYRCNIQSGIKDYRLANNNTASALKLSFHPKQLELNVRSAYRFHPTPQYSVMGKLLYHGIEYYSGIHFKVYNISITGIGISIPPKTIEKIKKSNPLLAIHAGEQAKIGLLLQRGNSKESIIALDSKLKIVRVNKGSTDSAGFAGASFFNLKPLAEETLNKFIHEAQMDEIRRLNRLYTAD